MQITAYDLAQRFVGTQETAGVASTPLIQAMLQLDTAHTLPDEVPWCSAYVNFIAWLLRLPRSKSLAARSWLTVGVPVDPKDAVAGFDVVVLRRGTADGPDVLTAPGHVGFFAKYEGDRVVLLGGNQSNAVGLARFPVADILRVCRLG